MAFGSNSVRFQTKFLIGWAILGLVPAMGLFIDEMISPSGSFNGIGDLLGNAIAIIPGMVIFGGFCLLIDGLFCHQGSFSQVTHPEWFWYVYPVFFVWSLTLTFLLGFLGIKSSSSGRSPSSITPEDVKKEVDNMTIDEFLKNFDDALKQEEKQGRINPEQQKIIRKLRKLDRSKYNQRFQEILNDNELYEFYKLFIKLVMSLGRRVG
ncbi:hypothetical protein PCC9214_04005 [Planktothrix tepida]|uniref:Uncharacterized protein n=1 Tax=Planktothrix tepida PCC 9214 TaxID=671072 RepID=A0A1J1LPF0_9CYAN|nr:hypothetical protein [Planktothrix tepida]CAD5973799.1 hypothetical protein PCC9214_04005 [Planktothrix tepida]CUR34395.1 membrane hypothetical protein [Planktothrix tepida PCC 9214]